MIDLAFDAGDAIIEAAMEQAGVAPECVEWYGDGDRVTIRLETHIGQYAEGVLHLQFGLDGAVHRLEQLSRELRDRRGAA